MIGTTLKNLLDEREIKVNEFARQIKVPAQTLYSIIRRDNMKIDFELLLRICDALHVPLETFCGTGCIHCNVTTTNYNNFFAGFDRRIIVITECFHQVISG